MPVPCSQEAQSRSSTTMLDIMFVSVSSPPQARALVAFVVSVGLPGCRSATSHVLVTLSSFLSNDREASVHVVCPQTRHHPLSVLLRPHHIALVISSFFSFFSHSLLFFIKQQGSSIAVRLKCASSHGGGTTASGGTEESCASKLRAFVFAVSV